MELHTCQEVWRTRVAGTPPEDMLAIMPTRTFSVVTGKSLDSPEQQNHDKISKNVWESQKIVRKLSKAPAKTKAYDFFWTFLSYWPVFSLDAVYSWKLPAYSGAFLLTVDNFSSFTYSWSFFAYSFSFLTYSWSFFAYSGKVRLIRALRGCKQRSLTVSKRAPTVSKKAPPVFLSW